MQEQQERWSQPSVAGSVVAILKKYPRIELEPLPKFTREVKFPAARRRSRGEGAFMSNVKLKDIVWGGRI